jgi:plasmid maintenance system antidote protein VapI
MTRRPSVVYPPGEFILEELPYRGWKQGEFLERLGWDAGTLTGVLLGSRRIDNKMANDLARVLGTSMTLWVSLQYVWDEWHERPTTDRRTGRFFVRADRRAFDL